MNRLQYKFSTSVRVRFAETDAQQVVYNSNYLVYFEVGRVNYFRNMGIKFSWSGDNQYDITLAGASCQFKSPARFDDEIEIFVRVPEIRHTSFIFEYLLINKATDAMVACGHTVMVLLDAATHKPVQIPEELRKKLESFEKGS